MISIQREGRFDVGMTLDMSNRRRSRNQCSNSSKQIITVQRIHAITVLLCMLCLFVLSSSYTEAFQTLNNIPKPRVVLRPDNDNKNNVYCNDHHAVSSSSTTRYYYYSSTKLYNLFPKDEFGKDPFLDDDDDDDYLKYDPAVAAQLRKAKQLIKDAKKKQKAHDESFLDTEVTTTEEKDFSSSDGGGGGGLPFFAAKHNKIKSKTKSGEIIADGDEMASLSKSEPWERRSLSQMFVKEKGTDWDGNIIDKDEVDRSVIMDKDVARSVYNLRKSMQTEDFRKVFDPRNRFIGEVD